MTILYDDHADTWWWIPETWEAPNNAFEIKPQNLSKNAVLLIIVWSLQLKISNLAQIMQFLKNSSPDNAVHIDFATWFLLTIALAIMVPLRRIVETKNIYRTIHQLLFLSNDATGTRYHRWFVSTQREMCWAPGILTLKSTFEYDLLSLNTCNYWNTRNVRLPIFSGCQGGEVQRNRAKETDIPTFETLWDCLGEYVCVIINA